MVTTEYGDFDLHKSWLYLILLELEFRNCCLCSCNSYSNKISISLSKMQWARGGFFFLVTTECRSTTRVLHMLINNILENNIIFYTFIYDMTYRLSFCLYLSYSSLENFSDILGWNQGNDQRVWLSSSMIFVMI